jgi:peptidoglycan/LPS O-acetylase OafA/YrhL
MNGVFWTLPFEWQFYFCLPFMFIFLRRYGAVALYSAALAVALGMKVTVIMMHNGYLQVFPLIRLDEFAAGMCAATLAVQRPFGARLALVMCSIGLGGLVATPWIFANYSDLGHYYDPVGFLRPLWLEATICLLLLGLAGPRHRLVFLFDNKVVVALGLVSYSIYLFHVPVLELSIAFGLLPSSQRTLLQVIGISLPLVIVVSAISYWFIERPFQAAGRIRPGVASRGTPSRLARFGPIRFVVVWAILLMLFLLAVARS